MLTINQPTPRPTSPHPVLNLGFRLFFLLGSIFCVLTMIMWGLLLHGVVDYSGKFNVFFWHAHEMIYGYGLAIIAGFLLTAVKTWTNQPMPYGKKLLWVAAPWVVARLALALYALVFDQTMGLFLLWVALVFDMVFWLLTTGFIVQAVWRVRQKRQIGIVVKLMLLWLGQSVFYWGVLTQDSEWQRLGIYWGFYLIIAVIFTIGRRVLPFFIQKGVMVDNDGKPNGVAYEQKNIAWLDKASLAGLVLFVLSELYLPKSGLGAVFVAGFAWLVAMVNGWRLVNWYHSGIWSKPLLWSLYGSFWGLVLGFVLLGLSAIKPEWHSFGVHTLAIAGIGATTLAMMARVSLGHTGRNIHHPPKAIAVMFFWIVMAWLCRVALPLVWSDGYLLSLMMAQVAWVIGFGLFLLMYAPILTKERIDGLFG